MSSLVAVSRSQILVCVLALAGATVAGCLGSDGGVGGDDVEALYDPDGWHIALPVAIDTLSGVATAAEVPNGAGIWVDGDHAYVSGPGSGFFLVNISDPAAPVVSSIVDEPSRDVTLLHHPDGRKLAVLSSGAVDIVDVTDPKEPFPVGSHPTEGAVHNVAVVPDSTVIYNSRSLDLPGVDILDAADPENIELVGVFGDLTCHDVTFAPTKDLAYCAGVRETQVWDVADPRAPVLLTRIHNPAIQIHHFALPAHEGDLLIIGDEFAGSTPAAAGCLPGPDAPMVPGTQSDPVGAIWFYDMTDPLMPMPIGYLSVPTPTDNLPAAPCTAHFGNIVEDADGPRDMLIMGWRYSGTHLIDFSDPTAPVLVSTFLDGGDTWDSQAIGGYVFTGNDVHGLEVLQFGTIGQEY